MKILESREEHLNNYKNRVYPQAKDPIKVLDLLIHLDKLDVHKFKDIEFDENGIENDEVIIITQWGKIVFDFDSEDNQEYTGEDDWDMWVNFTYKDTKKRPLYTLTMKGNGKGKRDDVWLTDYTEITNIIKTRDNVGH